MSAVPMNERSASAPVQPIIREYPPLSGVHEAVGAAAMRFSLKAFFKSIMKPPTPVQVERVVMEILSASMPPALGVKIDKIRVGDMKAECLTPRQQPQPRHAILYLHGGAFCTGSPRTHRSITTRLAKFADAQVLAIDYRLVPEHPFPAQIEDAVTGFKHLLQQGYTPDRIAVAGDSAGGTLTLLVAKALELEGLPQPRCLVMMSPAFDPALNSQSVKKNSKIDPMINVSWGHQGFAWYRARHDHPLAFPKRQNLSTLPPTLVQVGEHEVLYDDAVWITHAGTRLGRHIELEVYLKRWHVFQVHAGIMPSSTLALQRQAAFMKQHWAA
ncbi:MAG: alpha/beta hydrolase [Aquabacterium sp.]